MDYLKYLLWIENTAKTATIEDTNLSGDKSHPQIHFMNPRENGDTIWTDVHMIRKFFDDSPPTKCDQVEFHQKLQIQPVALFDCFESRKRSRNTTELQRFEAGSLDADVKVCYPFYVNLHSKHK